MQREVDPARELVIRLPRNSIRPTIEQIEEQPPLPFLLPKKMEVEEDTWVPLVNSDPFVSSPRNLLAMPTVPSPTAVTEFFGSSSQPPPCPCKRDAE